MRIGSLFTGIGGLDLAVEHHFGADLAWACEYDPHCRTVLERRFPGVPIYPDVRELGADTPAVDILVGGYPCQPFSVAGLRKGEDDPRHLWPHFARLIRLLRPSVVVAENVSGHLRLGFHAVLADLAALGMDVRWGTVRASDVGAPHRRERLFIVAWDPAGRGRDGRQDVEGFGAAWGDGAAWSGEGATANTDGSGGEARRDTGSDSARVGLQPLGSAAAVADAQDERDQNGPRRDGREPAVVGPESGTSVGTVAGNPAERVSDVGRGAGVEWGAYAPAIERWEHLRGRAAPRPTDDRGRLMPEFVEWMMGFPGGWTDGASRTQRLKMLGNAVVPQQAALALSLLAPELAHVQKAAA